MSELLTQQAALDPRPRRDHARIMTVVLEGEIGLTEMAEVSEMLARLEGDGVRQIIVDLAGVTHLDYRGVKHLIRHADSFRALSGDLKLAGLTPYLHAIFRSAGGHDAFDCFATAEDAKAAYLRPALAQGG